MANNPFDRTIINLRERPLSSDINQAQSQLDRSMREYLMRVLAPRASNSSSASSPGSGFIADAFKVKAKSPAAMQITVTAGLGFQFDAVDVPSAIGGIIGLDDLNPYKPLSLLSDATINIPAADPANPRIDIVEVKDFRRAENPISRDILDPATGAFVSSSVNKTLAFNLDGQLSVNGSSAINYKTGTPAGVPVVPSVDAGYIKLCEITVGASIGSVDDDKIVDRRKLLMPGGTAMCSMQATRDNGANPQIQVSNVVAPPGIEMTCLGNSSGAFGLDVGVSGFIFAADAIKNFVIHGFFQDSTGTVNSSNLYFAWRFGGSVATAPDLGALSSGDATSLLDATLTSITLKKAVGSTRLRWFAQSSRIDGTDPDGGTKPGRWFWQVHLGF